MHPISPHLSRKWRWNIVSREGRVSAFMGRALDIDPRKNGEHMLFSPRVIRLQSPSSSKLISYAPSYAGPGVKITSLVRLHDDHPTTVRTRTRIR